MRKLLLTTVTAIGATMGIVGGAYAQTTAAPAPLNGASGVSGLGAPPPTASMSSASGMVAPNSFVVHLNGRINWYAGVEGSSLDNIDGFKSDPYQFQGYIRLYPGFDAVAANGMQYGVVSEIRMPGATHTGAGTSPGSTSSAETLYWFQAYGYVGTADLGTFSFGMQNGPTANFETGTFEGFNDGAWNGDVPGFVPGNAAPVYPFSDVGPLQTGDKIVYMSPSWSGFQFGLSFEPNSNNLWNGNCSNGAATTGSPLMAACNSTSAAPLPGANARLRNMIDIGAQYTGTFGPVGVQVGGGWVYSGKVNYDGPPTPLNLNYYGLGVGQVGATITVANFTFGGNFSYGQQNGLYTPLIQGGVNEVAWMLGAQYGVGPWVVGGSYFRTNYAGNWLPDSGVARTATDQGIAAGGTYEVAPGFALYLSYLYGLRHQIGQDFATGDPNTAADPGVGNNVSSQVFALGTVMKW